MLASKTGAFRIFLPSLSRGLALKAMQRPPRRLWNPRTTTARAAGLQLPDVVLKRKAVDSNHFSKISAVLAIEGGTVLANLLCVSRDSMGPSWVSARTFARGEGLDSARRTATLKQVPGLFREALPAVCASKYCYQPEEHALPATQAVNAGPAALSHMAGSSLLRSSRSLEP